MTLVPKQNTWISVLTILLVIMGVEIVYLVYQNRRLQRTVASLAQPFNTLKQEQRVPAIVGEDVTGKSVDITYSSDAPYTMLFWFSPSCDVCQENAAFWNETYVRFPPGKLRYVGLCAASEDEARQYATLHGMAFRVISIMDDRLVQAYNGHVLPQTAIVSPDGRILKAWPGALDRSRQDEITKTLQDLTGAPD
jgi:peroxiredoxin